MSPEELNENNLQLFIQELTRHEQIEKYMKLLIDTFYKRKYDKITIMELHKVRFRKSKKPTVTVIYKFNLISNCDKLKYINMFLSPKNQINLEYRGKVRVTPYGQHLEDDQGIIYLYE